MRLIAGALNKKTLGELTERLTPQTKAIKVAVAYASYDCMELFRMAEQHKASLQFYGRYDHQIAVDPAVIKWFLDRSYIPTLKCRLVPDFYHPKVIWWVGHGVYIGSANLSNRAWTKNIEIGTFISEEEMQATGLDVELDDLFSEIEIRSHAISNSYLDHLKSLIKANKVLDDAMAELQRNFATMRYFPPGDSLVTTDKKSPMDREKEKFQRERIRALETLHILENRVSADSNRPSWIPADTAKGVQVDQFLYAYHSQYVTGVDANVNVEAAFLKNKNRGEAALDEAIAWWHAAEYRYDDMSLMVNQTARRLQHLFSKHKLPTLDIDEFCEALGAIHAIQQFVMNKPNAEMGLPAKQTMLVKLRRHGEELWSKQSPAGKTPLETLQYLIWGSDMENIETRIWNASRDRKWALPWTRESTLSDILGWARPDDYPPINGRSLKALRALGFDVQEDPVGK